MNQLSFLVTGANGFVGRALCAALLERGCQVQAVSRTARSDSLLPTIEVGDIHRGTDWGKILQGVDVVIHLAARVHVMDDQGANTLRAYLDTNLHGSVRLARDAAKQGVKRFVFVSSVKVNGECTHEQPFDEDTPPHPQDPYGISKWQAEQALIQLSAETGMEVVIIRPPLVYGPGVKGNFASMIRWVKAGVPLPLGAIHNKRSLISLDNLVNLIVTCIDHPAAKNQVFLASDGEDLSTTDLLARLAMTADVPSRLLPIPAVLLSASLTILGKKTIAQRLLGSLQVDISKTRSLLGWSPPLSVDEGLRRCFDI
ncbi:SDR family oxidoreductase [Methylobacillus gramineus]|uniref:UDP-glucose 4-epimerase family protein n=1 Tax=Methylobacillus gramineus TaxID=755169 RepID=UPI001CFF79A7|nr:SDR family oxidoreductase [Methylobacillus gramineus]MCB5184131.1 SDR family oxidoreductase [Methylobacillus gramineus]